MVLPSELVAALFKFGVFNDVQSECFGTVSGILKWLGDSG